VSSQQQKRFESALKKVADGEADALVGETLSGVGHPAAAQARKDLAGQRAFVKAEVIDLQVASDDAHVALRLAVAPDAVDFRSSGGLRLESLALNGVPVYELHAQPPRATVDSRGQPSFEFLVSGTIERTLAPDLRSMTSLSIEGMLADGRFLGALKAG
jgi:hypothetical protein